MRTTRTCYRCRARKVPNGRRVCRQCSLDGKPREFQCRECGEAFTSKGVRTCSRCMERRRAKKCVDCGTQISFRSTRCIPCRAKTQVKDGTRFIHHGYAYVRCPDHPGANASGRVREHRLVMEGVIGRYLRPNENVHHRNGDTIDNRPENLELWVKSQPTGQRVSDLLEWAREIISTYEPIEENI